MRDQNKSRRSTCTLRLRDCSAHGQPLTPNCVPTLTCECRDSNDLPKAVASAHRHFVRLLMRLLLAAPSHQLLPYTGLPLARRIPHLHNIHDAVRERSLCMVGEA